MLNYRRDGSPFVNLLLIAPLYDNKGHVRYFLGCQIDVSPLVEGGRGLESFARLLARDRSEARFEGPREEAQERLAELGALWGEDEAEVVMRERRASETSMGSTVGRRRGEGRRILGMGIEDDADEGAAGRALWPHSRLGPSGRLPGVYQNVSPLATLLPNYATIDGQS